MVGQLMSKAAAMSPDASGPLRSMASMRRRIGWVRDLNRLFIGRKLIRKHAKCNRCSSGLASLRHGHGLWLRSVQKLRVVLMEIRDQIVLITCGALGVGAATARAFAGQCARVAINWRNSGERAEALAAELGERALAVQCDVTDRAG